MIALKIKNMYSTTSSSLYEYLYQIILLFEVVSLSLEYDTGMKCQVQKDPYTPYRA